MSGNIGGVKKSEPASVLNALEDILRSNGLQQEDNENQFFENIQQQQPKKSKNGNTKNFFLFCLQGCEELNEKNLFSFFFVFF